MRNNCEATIHPQVVGPSVLPVIRSHQKAAILTVLEARGLEVPAKVRKVVLSCTDLAQLDAWLRAAVTTPSAEALLTPAAPSPSPAARKIRR